LHGGLDECFRSRRAVDIYRLGPVKVPYLRQKKTETAGVIVVLMSNKYGSNLPHVHRSFREPACDPVARVYDIIDAINNQ
jgi:hypothetical protein